MKVIKSAKQRIMAMLMSILCLTMIVPSGTTTFAAEMPKTDTYNVSLVQSSGGTISFADTGKSTATFTEGDTVDLNLTPDDGYQSSGLTVSYADDGEIAAEDDSEGMTSYSFEMPAADLTVEAAWTSTVSEISSEFDIGEVSDDISIDNAESEDSSYIEVAEDSGDGEPEEISDEIDVEETEDITTDALLEQYIRENADPAYVGEGNPSLINYMLVKQTIFDGTYVKSNDTIDSIMYTIESSNSTEAELEAAYDKFMFQTDSYVAVYKFSMDADYFVALIDTMIDDSDFTAREAAFAENNDEGIELEGCIFDKSTGLAYIPKEYFFADETTIIPMGTQAQVMQVMKPGGQETDVTVTVTDGDEMTSAYLNKTTIYDTVTSVYTETGLKENNLEVSINGVAIDDEDFSYDPSTGLITVNASPSAVKNIAIEVEQSSLLSRIGDAFSNVLDSITAYAAADYDSWSFYSSSTIDIGDLAGLNSVTGTAGIQYVNTTKARAKNVYGTIWSDQSWAELASAIYYDKSLEGFTLQDISNQTYSTFNVYLNLGTPTDVYNVISDMVPGFEKFSTAVILQCTHVKSGVDAPFNGTNKTTSSGVILEDQPIHVKNYYEGTDSSTGKSYAVLGIVTHFVNSQAGCGLIKVYTTGESYEEPIESQAYYRARQAQPQMLDIYVNKEDCDTGEELEGAEFTIYCDGDEMGTVTTDKNGVACYHWTGDPLVSSYKSSVVTFCTNYSNISPTDQANYSSPHRNRKEAYDYAKETVVNSLKTELATLRETTHKWKVVETKSPEGYNIHEDYFEETIPITTSAIEITFSDEGRGWLTIQKSSDNTSVTDGNNCYSIEGISFNIYSDKSCSKLAGTLTTDAKGNTDSIMLMAGTYWVQEDKASTEGTGYYWDGYPDDPPVYEIEITPEYKEDNPYVLKISDVPMNDPLGLTIYKIDAATGKAVPQGDTTLAGAEFTIKYYDGYYDESTLPSSATRTWVIQTKYRESTGEYRAMLDDDHLVSGDKLYYTNAGLPTLPLGTYTIQETSAPTGYRIEGEFEDSDGEVVCKAGEVFLTQYVDNYSGEWLYGGNVYTGTDTPQYGGVIVAKADKELTDNIDGYDGSYPQGNATLNNATFKLYNRSANSVRVNGCVAYNKITQNRKENSL